MIINATSPPQSLNLELNVGSCVAQIRRNVGSYSAIYNADSKRVGQEQIELDAGQSYTTNMTEIDQLVVSTSGPLDLSAVTAHSTIIMAIRSLLVLDQTLTAFTLTNNGTSKIRAGLNYVGH